MADEQAEASSSSAWSKTLVAGPSPYHESSQYRDWRYSPSQLTSLREALNKKSVEVVTRNTELEKEAQKKLGHDFQDPPPLTSYLSVQDEQLLLRFYLSQASTIIRQGFGLPEVVESTAMSYLKRFYLKNSVMEWHPRIIMPTCIYLAAKTTNYPVLMEHFTPKFAKLDAQEIIDTEFVVSQSLSFQFWVRTPEKALRGWALDLQTKPKADVKAVKKSISSALTFLSASRLTDAEFIFTPSQISLAALRLADRGLVDEYLEWKYEENGETTFGLTKGRLVEILVELEAMIETGKTELDRKTVKDIDKRLKQCSNPAKIPGTALYIQRKEEQAKEVAAQKAEKTLKLKEGMSDRDMVFGDVIRPTQSKKDTKTWSPRVTMGSDRPLDGAKMEPSGMGLKDEAMGNLIGGAGLRDIGKTHEDI
ncbi:putative cyclin-dependent protein kinase regulator [Kockovaella imperatae]|uniref:Putative cyclin-dependent protein kinase regulator n=1 Tax=Kockovaella imperatae TaxID=4999 RepID=A0A1Y1UPK4_9TREE|nr:putative cyclin-dependent protein kinase regulator [Kockovaella imperatae]ORX39396.1 putative cyclin-dependent protein kinase regulator [Kockovaella imperatae]